MKELLKNNDLLKLPRIGDIVEGKVIGWGHSSLFLDLGRIGAGIIYGKEFQEAKDNLKDLKIGDKIVAKIIGLENEQGYIELSAKRAYQELIWKTLNQKKEKGEILTVKILGANKGGLLAKVSGLPAFLPVSQLSPEHYPRVKGADSNKILRELQKFIGKELEVKIFSLDPGEEKIILSEKAKGVEMLKEVLKNYKVGDIVKGEITALVDFGAFIKFPLEEKKHKIEGLIHISELDWGIIEDPSKIVKVGQKVKAKIIDISNGQVSLSLKALKKDPWQDITKYYKKGETIIGKVTKFNPFGAFVQLSFSKSKSSRAQQLKTQGLCHISEFGTEAKMEEKLKIGKEYNFQILSIDPKEHRINLKLIE